MGVLHSVSPLEWNVRGISPGGLIESYKQVYGITG